jgi:hypothetical protein
MFKLYFLFPVKYAIRYPYELLMLQSGGRSVGIVRSRTKATELVGCSVIQNSSQISYYRPFAEYCPYIPYIP